MTEENTTSKKTENTKKKENDFNQEQWIEDSAALFYQIFSGEYGDYFLEKLKAGGGGNSFLGATWYSASEKFDQKRISKAAYLLLCYKIDEIAGKKDEHKKYIQLSGDTVNVSKKLFCHKSFHGLFSNNAKGAKNRIKNGKYFHFDHNPSNKGVFDLLYDMVQNDNYDSKKLAEEIKDIQKVDLITVFEDDIRTYSDIKLEIKQTFQQRDALLKDPSNYEKEYGKNDQTYNLKNLIADLPNDIQSDIYNALIKDPVFYNLNEY